MDDGNNDRPPKRNEIWALYSKKMTEENIRLEFIAKHGYPPRTIYFTGGGWLAGPLRPEERIAADEHVVTGVEI